MQDYNNPGTLMRALNPFLPKPISDMRWHPDDTALAIYMFVSGRPAPQGSKNYLPNGGGKESSRYLAGWRADVRTAFKGHPVPFDQAGPAYVDLQFVLQRPKNEPKSRPTRPHLGKPDVDKLARGVIDALTSAGVFRDDSQVICLTAQKRYAEEGELTGCHVTVGPCSLS